jgi:DNA polymerase III delta subunit
MAAAPAITLIMGADRTRMRAELARIRDGWDEAAVTVMPAQAGGAAQILQDTMTMGLLAEQRLIVVHGVEAWNAADVDALIAWKADPPPDVQLVLTAHELRSNSRLLKACSGSLIKVAAPSDPGKIAAWVAEQFEQAGQRVSREVATVLVRQAGSDSLDRLASDIERIITWADGEPITRQVVETLATPHVADEKVWALTDAWSARDRSGFIRMSQQLLDQGEEPYRLVLVLARHLRIVSDTVRMLAASSPTQAMHQLVASGTNQWVARRYVEQAQRLSQPRVDAALARSVLLEAELKGASSLASGRVSGDRPASHIVFHRALLELV